MRNWDAQERPPPKFYFAYGSALYELGRLSQDEEFEPYLDAAEERLDDGLDRFNELQQDDKNEHIAYAHKIRVALAKIWIAKVKHQPTEMTISYFIIRLLAKFKKAPPPYPIWQSKH